MAEQQNADETIIQKFRTRRNEEYSRAVRLSYNGLSWELSKCTSAVQANVPRKSEIHTSNSSEDCSSEDSLLQDQTSVKDNDAHNKVVFQDLSTRMLCMYKSHHCIQQSALMTFQCPHWQHYSLSYSVRSFQAHHRYSRRPLSPPLLDSSQRSFLTDHDPFCHRPSYGSDR